MKVFKSVILSLILFSSGTAQADVARDDGGHDGGGANLWTSSAAQVKAAIEWTLNETKNGGSWLFFAMPYGPHAPKNADGNSPTVIQCLAQPIVCQDIEQILKAIEEGRPYTVYSTPWDYLKLSQIELKEDGPCPASNKAHAAGSVSEFKIGAKLCLSVSELSRTVPSGLRAQVASVLAHEMAHLMGYDEEIAFGVQQGIVENFPRITREDGSFLSYRLVGAMMTVDSALANAKSFSSDDQTGIGYFLVGYAAGALNTIMDMLPDGLNDKTIPVAKPELFESLKTGFRNLENDLTGLAWKAGKLSDAQFDQEVVELRNKAEALSLMLEDFLGQHVIRFKK